MNSELFSVGIVAYNQHQYIFQCIDSILKQDYPQIELIIADDHSYDFDKKVIEKYIEKHKRSNLVHYVVFSNSENVGIVKNCNLCIGKMTGQYIKTIAADDMLYSKKVLSQMHSLLQNENHQIICARAKAITAEGKMTNDIYPSDYDFNTISSMSSRELYIYMITRPWCPIFAPAVFMKRNFFYHMGGYDENYKYTEDWPFWVRIAREGYNFTFSNEITIRYRYGGISNKGSNEFSINHLRAQHYQECAALLRNELRYLRTIATHSQVARCKYSADAIEMRRELECFWKSYSWKYKLQYRIKKLPTIFYIKLMSAITHKKRFHLRTESIMALLMGGTIYANIAVFPWNVSLYLQAILFVISVGLLIIKLAINAILTLLSGRAAVLTKIRGR